jgi:DNA polymerase (family X)
VKGGTNRFVADQLVALADLVEMQGGAPFRVRAYRAAAETVAGLETDVGTILAERGMTGLDALPGVGPSIAAAIREIVETGALSRIGRLRGTLDAEAVFRTVPGIGRVTARLIHDELHIDTLEALEAAAHDGRLQALRGIGPRKAAAIRAALEALLARRRPGRVARGQEPPPVAAILAVDDDYRRRAEAGSLPLIAPRRFNPTGAANLPILHAVRDGWHFTALYSNTPRAHELGRTRDWVVIYYEREDGPESQVTVVTERQGPLSGRRVIRGHEADCARHYAEAEA